MVNISALMTADPRGLITDANPEAEALTGCTRDELIGAPFKNYFTESALPDGAITRVVSTGRVMQKPILRQELHESLVDLGLFPLAQGGLLKVLIVDDDPRAVELVAIRIVGLLGPSAQVLRAGGGREAIEIARREVPDLVVLDLMMPGVNGFDVVTALQNRTETMRIPVLVVTAKEITAEDRATLRGCVSVVFEKWKFRSDRFRAEVLSATAFRQSPTETDVEIKI